MVLKLKKSDAYEHVEDNTWLKRLAEYGLEQNINMQNVIKTQLFCDDFVKLLPYQF